VSRWTCPHCDREFGRANQSHVCVPGGSVDECFAGRPPWQRDVYEAVHRFVSALGPVHVDAVRVGVFLKSDRKLAEVRPMARSVSLSLVLPAAVDNPRMSRTMTISEDRVANVVKLTSVADVDDQVRAWLADAFDHATD